MHDSIDRSPTAREELGCGDQIKARLWEFLGLGHMHGSSGPVRGGAGAMYER